MGNLRRIVMLREHYPPDKKTGREALGSPALKIDRRRVRARAAGVGLLAYQGMLVANCRKRPWTVRVTLPMEPPKKLVPSMIGPPLMML